MNLRTTIRRARAVAALYLTAYIDAEIAYRGHSDTEGNDERLSAVSAYRDAVDAIGATIGEWAGYPVLCDGETIGSIIRESGVGLRLDGHEAWRAAVGADVDARIADPKGTRERPLPVPFRFLRSVEAGGTQP